MKNEKGFILFENCRLVRGYNRSLIYDLQRLSFHFIPNDLLEMMYNHQGKSIEEVKENYSKEDGFIIDEYFEFLISNELIFFTDTPNWFSKMSLSYHYPFKVSNAIIDYKSNSPYSIFNTFEELSLLKCKHLEIRFYDITNPKLLEKIFIFLSETKSIICSVGIITPFLSELDTNASNYFYSYPRLSYMILSDSLEDELIRVETETLKYVIKTKNKICSNIHCGLINKQFFYPNIDLFTESQSHNSCLNRKISIDVNGDIKNCPSMPQSFGNIKDTSLIEAVNHPDFKKYWNITKDQIDVCKDCEFRYVCTDCRAYLDNPEDQYSKPLKCGYDPYTNIWEEWSTNPLKQKAIAYYGMQELIKKHD